MESLNFIPEEVNDFFGNNEGQSILILTFKPMQLNHYNHRDGIEYKSI